MDFKGADYCALADSYSLSSIRAMIVPVFDMVNGMTSLGHRCQGIVDR